MSTAVRVLQGKFGRVALLDMDRPLVTHGHSQCHVLIKVSGEDTFFTVRDKVYPLNDQTAVLINSWEPHAYTHHNPDAPRTIILALYIEPLWLGEIEKALIASGHPGFFPQSWWKFPNPSATCRRHWRCRAVWRQLGAQQLETQLSNLMIAVVDAFSEWRNFNDMRQIVLPQAPDFRIRRAISFMRDNVGIDVDVDKLATEACLSRAHFFKLFQQHTGLTPHLYQNVLRMEAAIEGLTQSRQSLASLSGDLGFSAQSHFTRFFQQHLGAVPSQYRKVVDVYADQT